MTQQFEDAQARVKRLTTSPSNADLLELYALYKQGAVGDVQGDRPGRLDFRNRAKYDAWAAKRGLATDAAMAQYIALVQRLGA